MNEHFWLTEEQMEWLRPFFPKSRGKPRVKDWRRIATCYDRCGELFLSAICIAATITFWL